MTFRRFMGFTAMAFLWTGSQIPVYLFGISTMKPLSGLNQWQSNIGHRWYSAVYLWIHRRLRSLDLVCTYTPIRVADEN